MPWLTADETAARYRITPKGLLKQRTEGRLPGSLGKRVGKRVLWASEDLDAHDGHEGPTPTNGFVWRAARSRPRSPGDEQTFGQAHHCSD